MSRRDRLSISARVAMAVTVVLAMGVTALSATSYVAVTRKLRADLDRTLLREAEAFAAAASRETTAGASPDLRAFARAYLETRSMTSAGSHPVLLVRLGDGRVLSNSDTRLENASPNRAALDAGSATRRFLDLSVDGTTYRAATVPITARRGAMTGVFEAALPVDAVSDLSVQLLGILATASMAVVLVGALASAWAARASLGPLLRAAATADRVTQQRLGERLRYDGPPDEVGSFVAAVNAMLDRLEHGFGEQRRFLADASHELRTPLTIVSGHLEALEHADLSPTEREEELAVVCDEVRRMGRLVDDMLALARLESAPTRPFQKLDVRVLLMEAAGRGRMLGDRTFDVEAAEDVWVCGDPDQLLQALLNLVGNAVRHTAPDGRVLLAATADRSKVRLRVEDSGTGLSDEDIERVFDRFYRAAGSRADGAGSGLGLAIVKRLVELHGGSVSAARGPEGGAVFTMVLPRTARPSD